ncbi:MAG TPA: protein translocase subunit SecF [Pyrinomonadaceae bacterium]|jgi:preprotein translocase subunit SecF|nr:protein translocase subunit SecF [Pyrinomonadaceae bacterium]
MIQFFKNASFDWLADRRIFIAISTLLMLVGLVSAVVRQAVPGGTDAFNLGVDFKGGTVVTAKFKQRPSAEEIRTAVNKQGLSDAVIQLATDKQDEVLIKLPQIGQAAASEGETQSQVDIGRAKVREALNTFGPEAKDDLNTDPQAAYKIVGTDAVGPVAGRQLRNQAIAVTLAALVGILLYIAFRFEWTYGAAAVIAVFHDVLVTLGFFSIFQWEISLTVIAALLTLVGFSVNDTIVVFDRIRENLRLHRRDSLYKVTNDSINQTLSRTIITSGLVFLSVLAMVIFGGDVLRGFSLALLIGIVFGTYSSIAIASPIMVWWQQRLDAARVHTPPAKSGRASEGATRTSKAKAAAL